LKKAHCYVIIPLRLYKMKKIILASSSPRRKELLESIGLKFAVKPSNIPEILNPRLGPRAQAEQLSRQKAQAVGKRVKNAIVIAADSLIVLNKEVIGKPSSILHAKRILKKLGGQTHIVVTGFTIVDTETEKTVTKSVETKVTMRNVSQKEIEAYVKKENVLDKAGAYAIQGVASIFFEKVEGDFFNIVGLPVHSLFQELKKFGVVVLA